MNETLDIVTYGNVRILAGVLRAIAYLFATPSMASMIAVAVGVGFIGALIAYMVAPHKLQGWWWLASVLAVQCVLLLPKVNVHVIDRLTYDAPQLVQRVPAGLAYVASFTSRIGDAVTENFETTFRDPAWSPTVPPGLSAWDQLTFRANGVMFGNKVIREASKVKYPGIDFRFNLNQYLQLCLFPEINLGRIPPTTFRSTTDLWSDFVGEPLANPARYAVNHAQRIVSCRTLQQWLRDHITAQENQASFRLAMLLNAATPGATTPDHMAQLEQAYLRNHLAGAAGDAANLIRQNALINAIGDATSSMSQRLNDPSAVLLGNADSQAKVSQNTAWITSGKLAEETLPMIRNGIEAILYAAFPIVIMAMFLTNGQSTVRLAKSYLGSLLWIQMWPPLFAVLNYMATAVSSQNLKAAGAIPGGGSGVSIMTHANIYNNAVSDMAVVGYLVMSVPVLAWALIKGMDSIASGALAGASMFAGASSGASTMASTASISLGNTTMDQVNTAPSKRDGFMTREDASGTTTQALDGSGFNSAQMRQSNIGIDASFVKSKAAAMQQRAESAYEAGQSVTQSMRESFGTTFSEINSLDATRSLSSIARERQGSATVGADGTSTTSTKSAFDGGDVADSGGSSKASKAGSSERNFTNEGTSGSIGGSLGPFGGVSQSVGRGTEKTGTDSQEESAFHEKIAKFAQGYKNSDDVSKTLSSMKTFMESTEFQQARERKDAQAMRFAAGYEEALELQGSREASFRESERLSSLATDMDQKSATMAVSLNNAVYTMMNQDGTYGEHVSDMRSNVPRAAERVEGYANRVFESMGDSSFGSGGPTAFGRPSRAVESRLEAEGDIAPERVESFRDRHPMSVTDPEAPGRTPLANTSDDEALAPRRQQFESTVKSAAAQRGLGSVGSRGGGAAPAPAAGMKDVTDQVAQADYDIKGQTYERRDDVNAELRGSEHNAVTPQQVDGQTPDPVSKVLNGMKAPSWFVGRK